MKDLEKLRGFREIYPEDMIVRAEIFEKFRTIGSIFGFLEIDAPSLEPLSLFEVKSGEEIVNQTFSFYDKSQRSVTLIPEITPAVARMVSRRKDLVKPIKWFSIPKLWRYEEPQAGRLREFYQFNIDIFGVSTIEADAEVIAVGAQFLNSVGLKDKYRIKISDRNILEKILVEKGVKDTEKVFRIIDRMEKRGEEITKKELENFMSSEAVLELLEILKKKGLGELNFIKNEEVEARKKELMRLERYLDMYGVEYEFDFSIVRGISYYTGLVFEAWDNKKEYRAILGGGRYDNVVELFSGQKIPAVGFGMGDAVLELLLRREKLWKATKDVGLNYYIVTDSESREYAISVLLELRNRGYSTDIDMSNKSFTNQFRYANKIGVKNVIIIGEEERMKDLVTVKDMNSGVQKNFTKSEFLSTLQKIGND